MSRSRNPFDNFSGAQFTFVDLFIQDVETQTNRLNSISQSELEHVIKTAVNKARDVYAESDLRRYESAIYTVMLLDNKKSKINIETKEMLLEILSNKDWRISEKVSAVNLQKMEYVTKFDPTPTDTYL